MPPETSGVEESSCSPYAPVLAAATRPVRQAPPPPTPENPPNKKSAKIPGSKNNSLILLLDFYFITNTMSCFTFFLE